MSATKRGSVCLAVGLCLAVLAGCGGPESTVSGTVTLDGRPLGKGVVTFYPVDSGPTAYADIGSGGSFSVRTGSRNGLKAGEYVVTVDAREMPPYGTGRGPAPMPRQLTPPHYADPKRTDLRATVTRGKNEIELTLQTPAQPRR